MRHRPESRFLGLFIGILATSLIQSSSAVTSITVGLAAGGALDIQTAIPIIMGSNVGTTVTNTLVAAGHINRPGEFRRAFSAATLDDVFNLLAILILFPLQLYTNFLGIGSSLLAQGLILANYTSRSKLIPFVYILLVFFAIPLALVYLVR